MKSFFIIGVFLLGLNSCSLSDGRDYSDLDMTNVIYEYNKKLSKEKLIELSSIYLDYNYNEESRGKIKGVDVRYSVSKRIQEEEAREWFRELIDGLLEKINSTEYLRKYFQHYPVSYEDLSISLRFSGEDIGGLKKGDVSSIRLDGNEISLEILEKDRFIKTEDHREAYQNTDKTSFADKCFFSFLYALYFFLFPSGS